MKSTRLIYLSLLIPSLALTITGCNKTEQKEQGLYDKEEKASNANGSMSYEIFVRTFYDTDNNQIGDLNGVTAKLPYLYDLGIKTIWLMPIHKTMSYHGYDVVDYKSVNPDYGTIQDFDNLVTEAKKYNIDIMLDMVFNHTSKECKWFKDSYIFYQDGDRDGVAMYYNWSTTGGTGYSKYGDLYYESRFDSSMPDLNLDSEDVRNELDDVCKFWIQDHGVKGFRLDAVLYYYYGQSSKNIEFLSWLSETTKKYDPNFYMVGEAWDDDGDKQIAYYQSGLDSFFNFRHSITGSKTLITLAKGTGSANYYAGDIEAYERALKAKNSNGYSSYFLSNHDQDRIAKSFYDEYVDCNKVAANLYCLLPGTPFMYYGEEISLKGARGSEQSDRLRRLPMIWSETDKTGECKAPENAKNYDQVTLGVEDQLQKEDSLVNHYKRVINVRNQYPFLKQGIFKNLTPSLEEESGYVMAYSISLGDESVIFVHNFGFESASMNNIGGKILNDLNVTAQRAKIDSGKLTLGPHSSVVLSAN